MDDDIGEVNGNVAADSLFGELRALPLVIASGGVQLMTGGTPISVPFGFTVEA